MSRGIANAKALWEVFHDKEPREEFDVVAPWPKAWGLSGEATRMYYRSDKWNHDGEYECYYHDHEGSVELWEPWGDQDWLCGKRTSPGSGIPCKTAAVLGYCLGWVLTNVDGVSMEVEFGDAEVYLCAVANGKTLFAVDVATDDVLAVWVGGSLDVLSDGIVG